MDSFEASCDKLLLFLKRDFGLKDTTIFLRTFHGTLLSSCFRLSPLVWSALLEALVLKSGDKKSQNRQLIGQIMRLASPLPSFSIPSSDMVAKETLEQSSLFAVILCQSLNKDKVVKDFVANLVRLASTVGYPSQLQLRCISAINSLSSMSVDSLNKDQVHIISIQLVEWLKSASLQQGSNPYSRALFGRRDDRQNPVTEIDGTNVKDFFTILCIGQYYSEDQLQNIHAFSLLGQWIATNHSTPAAQDLAPTNLPMFPTPRPITVCPKLSDSYSTEFDMSVSSSAYSEEDKFESFSDTSSMQDVSLIEDDRISIQSSMSELSIVSTVSTLSTRLDPFTDGAVKYCFRLLKQCHRKAKSRQDVDLQSACQIECLNILDRLATETPTVALKTSEPLRQLVGKLQQNQPRVILAAIQFFLHHGKYTGYDPSLLYEQYFKQVLSHYYSNTGVAFDTVSLILENLETLCNDTQLLHKYFPNILKVLAWNARSYMLDFVELMPALMSPGSAVELLHTLLDLPCMAAALEVKFAISSQRASSQAKRITQQILSPDIMVIMDYFGSTQYKPYFECLLRKEAGTSEYVDRLNPVLTMLLPLQNLARVRVCCDAVPVLLRTYLDVLVSIRGQSTAAQVFPVLLKRSSTLYNSPPFCRKVNQVLSNGIQDLLKKYPCLVGDVWRELSDFITKTSMEHKDEDFLVTVVWCVGDYMSSVYDAHCTPERVALMYDAFEVTIFEAIKSVMSDATPCVSARLLSTYMAAIAKLASRNTELLPRAVLCISKLGQLELTRNSNRSRLLSSRATELLGLLQLPNIASVVLNPPPDAENSRWHKDTTSLPMLLRTTTYLLGDGAQVTQESTQLLGP